MREESKDSQTQSFGQPSPPQKGPQRPPLCEGFEHPQRPLLHEEFNEPSELQEKPLMLTIWVWKCQEGTVRVSKADSKRRAGRDRIFTNCRRHKEGLRDPCSMRD